MHLIVQHIRRFYYDIVDSTLDHHRGKMLHYLQDTAFDIDERSKCILKNELNKIHGSCFDDDLYSQ